MKIYIDQSGKIENTNKHTILALSNDQKCSVLIPAKIKRQLLEIFRMKGNKKRFIFRTFAAGIFILLKYAKLNNKEIVIDMEYPGRDKQIKIFLETMTSKDAMSFEFVFQRIGKKSDAHHIAYQTNKKRLQANKIVNLKEIRQILSL